MGWNLKRTPQIRKRVSSLSLEQTIKFAFSLSATFSLTRRFLRCCPMCSSKLIYVFFEPSFVFFVPSFFLNGWWPPTCLIFNHRFKVHKRWVRNLNGQDCVMGTDFLAPPEYERESPHSILRLFFFIWFCVFLMLCERTRWFFPSAFGIDF